MGHAGDRSNDRSVADEASGIPFSGVKYDDIDRGAVLGGGGNATVYKATVKTADSPRTVVIKEAANGADADRFLEATRTWDRLDEHDRIVDVLDWGQSPCPWVVLEHVSGGDLRSWLAEAGSDGFPPAVALRVTAQVVDALRYAHRRGVAHLDVAPENVLVESADADGPTTVLLSDWGLSRRLLDDETSAVGLRPRYAAPEQLEPDGAPPDDRADVYQTGALLYELLTGRRPQADTSRVDHGQETQAGYPVPPTEANPDLPDAVNDVIGRAMASSRGSRYESSLDLRRDVVRLLAAECDGTPMMSFDDPASGRGKVSAAEARSSRTGSEGSAVTELETQGFVSLDTAYFRRHELLPLPRALRTGPTLADVAAGRAVKRTARDTTAASADGPSPEVRDEPTDTVSDRLVTALSEGSDAALLGPAGCGKSTVCKSVAYEWRDRTGGAVHYWDPDEPGCIDRPGVLKRAFSQSTAPTLVIVEDAVRPAANEVISVAASLVNRPDVVFLFEAREATWHEPRDVDIGARVDAYRHEQVKTVHLSHPDRGECRRFVEWFRRRTDRDIDPDTDQLLDDLRPAVPSSSTGGSGGDDVIDSVDPDGVVTTERDTYNLLVLIERLTAFVGVGTMAKSGDISNPTDRAPSRLAEAVDRVYDELAADDDATLRAGVLANLLNAIGIAVSRDLVAAIAVADESVDAGAIDRALELLEGRMLFGADHTDGAPTSAQYSYEAVQQAWSVEFLDRLMDRAGETRAHRTFAACASAVLTLATSEPRRTAVTRVCQGRTPALDRIEADPKAWRDRFTERLFLLGREWPRLAPLFGSPEYSRLAVPDGCPPNLRLRCLRWHGEMCLNADRHDRAATAFDRLREVATGSETASHDEEGVDPDQWRARARLGLGRVAWSRNEYDVAETELKGALAMYRETGHQAGAGRARKNLGIVARKRGDYDTAMSRLKKALGIAREVEDRRFEAQTLNELGSIALSRTEYDAAVDRYRESLERRRDIGDRRGIAGCLNNIAHVSYRRGNPERARDRYRRAYLVYDAVGDRQGAAHSLVGAGLVARRQGEYSRAADCFERAIEVYRDVDDEESLASCLVNLGVVAESEGELVTAKQRFQSALDAFESIGSERGCAVSLRNLGEIAHRHADLDEADRLLRQALDRYRSLDSRRGVAMVLVECGVVALKRGNLAAAAARSRQGVGIAQNADEVMIAADGFEALGRVQIAAGGPDAAARHLRRSLRVRKEVDDPEGCTVCYALLGRALAQRGTSDVATERLAEALDRAEGSPGPAAAEVQFQRAAVARLRGNQHDAREAYEAALKTYRETEGVYGEIRCLRELVAFDPPAAPDDALAKCEIGNRLASDRGLDDAAAYFRRRHEEFRA